MPVLRESDRAVAMTSGSSEEGGTSYNKLVSP